jgi:multiple sugar transport system substrate-binding protein
MKRFRFALVGMVAVVALGLSACSGGGTATPGAAPATFNPDEKVTLTMTWWGNADRATRYGNAIKAFNAKYPNITVQTSFASFADYWPARATEAASHSLPDVMQFDLSYIREYSQNNQLLDLQPEIDNHTIDLSTFDANLVKSGSIGGKQIGIPTSTNTLAMFTNEPVLKQIGVPVPDPATYTWSDYNAFLAKAAAAGAKSADGHQLYGSNDYTGTFWFFIQWLLQKGVTPFKDDGTLGFTKSDVVDFLNLTSDLRSAKQLYPIDRQVALTPKDGFTTNEAASEMSWDNFLAQFSTDSGSTIKIMPLPSIDAGKKNLFYKPSMLLAAGANTTHAAAAATLINFLLNDPQVGSIFGTSKGVPAAKAQRDAIKADPASIDGQVIAYEELVAKQVTQPTPIPVKGFGTIEAKWLSLGQDLDYGKTTPADFADQWFTEAAIDMK